MPLDFDVNEFARSWVDAWNRHDLEEILSHYSPSVTLTSPAASKLMGNESGAINGKEALRAYFTKGLQAYPGLQFELIETLQGIRSVVLYYKNQTGGRTAEFMEFNDSGEIIRVVANYSVR